MDINSALKTWALHPAHKQQKYRRATAIQHDFESARRDTRSTQKYMSELTSHQIHTIYIIMTCVQKQTQLD